MSLLSHLLAGSEREEVYSTSALAYLLARNALCRAALLDDWRKEFGLALSGDLAFKTEALAGGGICDIAGVDAEGLTRVLIEGKFWASLTDHQPGSYLDALDQDGGGLLLFVAPGRRFETLWPELLRRASDRGVRVEEQPTQTPHMRRASLAGSGSVLALTSWNALLDALRGQAARLSDPSLAADIDQLAELCRRMDETGFLPLRSSEMSSEVGLRIVQLQDVFVDLLNRLFARGIASKQPKLKNSNDWRPIRVGRRRAYLRFWFGGWATHRATPFWLAFPRTGDDLLDAEQWALLARLETQTPPGIVKEDSHWMLPLHLPLGVERSDVLDALFDQVRAGVDRLGLLEEAPAGIVPTNGSAASVPALDAAAEVGAVAESRVEPEADSFGSRGEASIPRD
ncbi:hypothetical protein BX589_10112 [Paraburkholderia fungorum]|jgi:hypothetical protein|uniref:hypothetical protein n=1 Tax=Paraburkholderia fungorum TaxID=134537 RepID=UPI000D04F47B|nr:hypothetical protein [Paraburkholderia fungorum]PRZ56362.1 hypothetical protein BX589_10112 [Paraburkholderia fungorum]